MNATNIFGICVAEIEATHVEASIAQGLEHWSCKPEIPSSIHGGGGIFYFCMSGQIT